MYILICLSNRNAGAKEVPERTGEFGMVIQSDMD